MMHEKNNDNKKELLLIELLVEEIPSRFQSAAIESFKELFLKQFHQLKIDYEHVNCYISPRRMVFMAYVNKMICGYTEEKKGPQIAVSEDVKVRFSQSCGLQALDLYEKTIDKKIFLFARIKHNDIFVSDLLNDIINNVINELNWPKSMKWNVYNFTFVRPIRNILVFFGNKELNVNLPKINLISNNFTYGHRFLSDNKKIIIRDSMEYKQHLLDNFVEINQDIRRNIIVKKFKEIEKKYAIKIDIENVLLDEVVGLVEYPVVLVGEISEKFMNLPEEVIVTPMKTHQRYFPTRLNNGKLCKYFVFVSNMQGIDNCAMIINGNQRVLNARLEDALFFYETDLKNKLELNVEKLKKITFQEKLGTFFDRIQRISKVIDIVYKHINFKIISNEINFVKKSILDDLYRVCLLAKCDLSSNMVCEFTELQGIIGGYYASIQGENDNVSCAIREQYYSAENVSNIVSALYIIADRLEIITAFFSIDKAPTGSKDPFALRRAAIVVIKLLNKFNISMDLSLVLREICNIFEQNVNKELHCNVCVFLIDRTKWLLKDIGIDNHAIAAVLRNEYNVINLYKKSQILCDFLNNQDDLLQSYKRAKNIIDNTYFGEIDNSLISEKEEHALLNKIILITKQFQIIDNNVSDFSEQYKEKLQELFGIVKFLADFFDNILVNVDDKKLQQNRINILWRVIKIFEQLADFNQYIV